jgi:hypothetical protein
MYLSNILPLAPLGLTIHPFPKFMTSVLSRIQISGRILQPTFFKPEIRFNNLLLIYSSSCSASAVYNGSFREKLALIELGLFARYDTCHINSHLTQHLVIMSENIDMTLFHLQRKIQFLYHSFLVFDRL